MGNVVFCSFRTATGFDVFLRIYVYSIGFLKLNRACIVFVTQLNDSHKINRIIL